MMLRIEFEDAVWAQIIDMLADQPYKRSGAIINTMAQQINEQRGEGNGKMASNGQALHQRDEAR